MADVFISYARGDQPVAEKIARHLTGAGFTAWWDSDLLPHNSFAKVIEEEISAAKAVLVIWSNAAIESQWVRAEAELGRSQRKLIQVMIADAPIPLPFNQYQAADLRHWHNDPANPQWSKVLASVAHFATGTAAGASAVAPFQVRSSVENERENGRRLLPTRPAMWLTLAGLLGVSVAGAALFWDSHGRSVRGERIAVQPFHTIGSAPVVRDFAAAMSDSLQNVLTKDQLQTVSPTEAETLTGDDAASRSNRLGVGLMFSGTVQAKGSDLSVNMRLDDPVQHATLWTAQMSQAAGQSDQLQARVGALTVAVLNCSAQALAPTVRLADPALQAFLNACDLSETSDHGLAGASSADAMLEAMRGATREAPDFAAAHSMLAKHLAFVAAVTDQPSLRTEAEVEAHRALQLDAKDPDGYVALGLLAPPLNFALREKLFRQALAIDPAWPHANGFLANVMTDVGRLEDALRLYRRAAVGNPLSVDWTQEVAGGLIQIGQTEEADRELSRFAQLWPEDDEIWRLQLQSFVAQKRWSDALKVLDRATTFGAAISPDWVARWRDLIVALQSDNAAIRNSERQKLLALSKTNPGQAIVRLGMLGLVDDAFGVAQRSSALSSNSPGFLFQPETAPLRHDARFMALAARFGLIDYWRRSGSWPDFCSDPTLPYSCEQYASKIGYR